MQQCDSVLFSKGIEQHQAGCIIKKLKHLSSKCFGKTFEMIHCTDVIKRTNNEKLFYILYVLEHAIKKCRKAVLKKVAMMNC